MSPWPGLNIPIRIGGTTVLPGDVVLGSPTGVLFIPPHLAQEVVESSEDVRVRDEFGKMRLAAGHLHQRRDRLGLARGHRGRLRELAQEGKR